MNNFYKFGVIPSSQPSGGGGVDIRGEAVYTSPGTYSWTCPEGVTSVCVEAIGGGGGGVKNSYGNRSANGGQGALAYKNNISVIPGQSYTVVVGSGGSGATINFMSSGSAAPGGDSYFINTSTIRAGGGNGGVYNGSAYAGGGGTYTGDGGINGSSGTTSAKTLYSLLSSGGNGGIGTNSAVYSGFRGCLRIIWGAGRAFPSTDIGLTE